MNEPSLIKLNEEEVKRLLLAEIQKRLDHVEFVSLLMDSKQLCKMLNLSWPTVEKVFISDPHFPSIRIGKKWAFNRREVADYLDRWCVDVRKKGGVFENE